MWTTLDGYRLGLPRMNPGRLRAWLYEADLQDLVAACYRGDLGQTARQIIGGLVAQAQRIECTPWFAVCLGKKGYRIRVQPVGREGFAIVGIKRWL